MLESLANLQKDTKMTNSNFAEEGGLFFCTGNSLSICDPPETSNSSASKSPLPNDIIDTSESISEKLDSIVEINKQVKNSERLDKNGSGFFNPAMVVYRDFVVLTSKLLYKKQIESFLTSQKEIKTSKTNTSKSIQSPFHFADPFSGCGPLPIRIMSELIKTRKEIQELFNKY